MLYFYKGKIYVKPFENKIVEVEVSKEGNNFDVKSTGKTVEINRNDVAEMTTLTTEEAYKKLNKEKNQGKDKTTLF